MAASFLNRLFHPRKTFTSAECIARFLSLREHRWIANQPVLLDRLAGFLCLLPPEDLKLILEERRLLLLYCNQKMSCSFYQYEKREVVLIFPELHTLLLSSQYLQAYAILAHELGHVYYEHSKIMIEPLHAQLEADRYAANLGFAEELFCVLQNENPIPEIRERLHALRVE